MSWHEAAKEWNKWKIIEHVLRLLFLPIVCRYFKQQQQMIIKHCFTGNKLVVKKEYFWIIKYCYCDLIAH